jgi:hypothetical protein
MNCDIAGRNVVDIRGAAATIVILSVGHRAACFKLASQRNNAQPMRPAQTPIA